MFAKPPSRDVWLLAGDSDGGHGVPTPANGPLSDRSHERSREIDGCSDSSFWFCFRPRARVADVPGVATRTFVRLHRVADDNGPVRMRGGRASSSSHSCFRDLHHGLLNQGNDPVHKPSGTPSTNRFVRKTKARPNAMSSRSDGNSTGTPCWLRILCRGPSASGPTIKGCAINRPPVDWTWIAQS